MTTLARVLIRLLRYFAQVLAWTAAGIAVVWLLVWVFPFLFEGTKAFWEFLMGVESVHTAVVGLACIVLAYLVAMTADITWRDVYLAPIIGGKAAQNVPPSRVQKLVIWLGTLEAAAVIFLLPGAFGVLDTIGRWLPEAGSPGVIGLAVILAGAVGTTVFLGDLWVFTWRAKPGHDLGPPKCPDLARPSAALHG